MLNTIVLNLVLGYVVSALAQFGASFNWSALKQELDQKLKALIPWSYFEGPLQAAADALLGVCASVLQDQSNLKALMEDVAKKDWADAVAALKALLLANWKPVSAEALALADFLQNGTYTAPSPPAPAQVPAKQPDPNAKPATPKLPDPAPAA